VALCERILAEDADIRLLERLDQIRLERAQVHAASGRYDSGRIGPLYRQAFTDYGLDVAARDPQVAADKLSGRPRHVLEACIFGLESWRAFLQSRVAEALWIDQVLELIDDDDWRREVRRACRQKDWPSVERLISTVQDEPASVDAVNLVAMQLINASQFELAHQLLQAVQPSYPGDFWINQFLGITWEHIPGRRPDESIRFYTAALAIRETAATYQNLGGILFELERDSEAEQAFRSAARMRPDWVVPHLDLAKLLAKQERLNEALECADQAVAAAPDQARVASIRGQIMIGLGRREEGLASLRRAVELDDKTAAWHLALGRALRDTGQLLEAVTCFRRTIELDHENVMGQEMLRDTLTDQEQTDGAIKAARAVVALRGEPDDYRALARLLEEQGKRDEAESLRKQASKEADRR
jgi:tetratricopeptide (TPR) repeat protein